MRLNRRQKAKYLNVLLTRHSKMDSNEIQYLIERYISDDITSAEIEKLRQQFNDPEFLAQLELIMDGQLTDNFVSANDYPGVIDRLKEMINGKINKEKKEPIVRHGS